MHIALIGILQPIYDVFGWLLYQMYLWIGNYGFVLILFTFFVRAFLIPLSFRTTVMTIKQQQIQPDLEALKREYKDDRMALAEAQSALMKKHNIRLGSSMLPSLLSLFLIIPIFRLVSSPLQYISGVSLENLQRMGSYLLNMNLITEGQLKSLATNDIVVNHVLQHHTAVLTHFVNQGWIGLKQLLNLNFLGIDIGLVPSYSPSRIFGSESSEYLPLLIIPVLAIVTTYLSGVIMERLNPNYKKLKEQKELAKKNPARQTPKDPMQNTMFMMKYVMVIITVWTSFVYPAVIGFYWIVSNIMIIVQQYLIYHLYYHPESQKNHTKKDE